MSTQQEKKNTLACIDLFEAEGYQDSWQHAMPFWVILTFAPTTCLLYTSDAADEMDGV